MSIGTGFGLLLLGVILGWLLALLTDASSKRAVAKLEQIVRREDQYRKSLLEAGHKVEGEFIRGIEATISNLRGHVDRLKKGL